MTINRANPPQKLSKEAIKDRFNQEMATHYSKEKPLWFPDLDYTFQLISETLGSYLKYENHILDIGAGTGNLSKTILETHRSLFITLVDFSENMLKEAPSVLSEFKGKFKTIKNDIFQMDFGKNSYDHAISSFAIHHGRTKNDYQQLYSRIYRALNPHGVFICCDVVEGDNPKISHINEQGWEKFLKKQGFSDNDVTDVFENYYKEDSPLSLFSHLTLLKSAGFNSVDVLWKKYNFAIYFASKSD